MGGSISLINSLTSSIINLLLQDISAIDIDKSMPNSAISFSLLSEALDAILEISDFSPVVSAFNLEVADLGLEVGDLGPLVDVFGLEVSDLFGLDWSGSRLKSTPSAYQKPELQSKYIL